jgi:RNA polymerase sigma factor (sigma-70 family)
VQAPEATDPDADPFVGLREAWPHLSPRQKAVLQLKYLADLTWDEVAVELGISVNQARYLARTAREVLRPFIDGTD